MDFLNKTFAQFSDLFPSMTPGGRITAGLLLVVAVVSVGYLFQSQVGGGDDYLFGGDSIPRATLRKMEGAFGNANLNNFTFEGNRVRVPRAQRAAYLKALVEGKALPPNFDDLLKDDDGSVFEAPKQKDERLRLRKQAAMSLVISLMQGIESAHVIIDQQPGFDGLDRTPLKTAVVEVTASGNIPLDDEQVENIHNFVKGAIAGIKPGNVTVIDGNGGSYVWENDFGGAGSSTYARAVHKTEQSLTAKIRSHLKYIPGVTVSTLAILDDKKGSRTVEIKNDPKPIPVRTSENSRTSNRDSSSVGGAPGVGAQGGGANQPASVGANGGKGSNETSDESKSETVSVVSQTRSEKESFDLVPKTTKASIGIPASYYEEVWRKKNPPKDGEEAKKPEAADLEKIADDVAKEVKAAVAILLPNAAEVKNPTSLVNVTTFQDIKTAEIHGPPATQRALTWLGQNWPMMAMVGLVVFSLGVLRSTLRGVPVPAAESAAVSMRVTGAEPKSEAEETVEAMAARRLRRMTGSGPSLRDELSELVKEDPDSAANVLRSWIGQVN